MKSKRFLMLPAGILMMMLAVTCFAQGVNIPARVGFVNDYAHLLSDEQRSSLDTELKKFFHDNAVEIVVVTLPDLDGQPVEEWGLQLGRQWRVGKGAEESKSIVFLVAPKERKARPEISRHLEGDLTDGRAGELMRHSIVPLTRQEKWAEGVIAGTHALMEEVALKVQQNRADNPPATAPSASPARSRVNTAIAIGLGATAFVLIVILVLWWIKQGEETETLMDSGEARDDDQPLKSSSHHRRVISGTSRHSPGRGSSSRRDRETERDRDAESAILPAAAYESLNRSSNDDDAASDRSSSISQSSDSDNETTELPDFGTSGGDFGGGGTTVDL